MNVISKDGMKQLTRNHPDCATAAMQWFRIAKRANWQNFEAVRQSINSADLVGNLLLFNLRGNAYRLIVRVNFKGQRLYVKALLSHQEYDKKEWMKWA